METKKLNEKVDAWLPILILVSTILSIGTALASLSKHYIEHKERQALKAK